MTDPEELTYERAAARIARITAGLAGIGTAVALAGWGWRAGAGFLIGSLLSGVQFLWLKGLVDALGSGKKRGRSLRMALRFLVLAGAAYAIFRLIPINPAAVLAGIFVLTAAVFAEVIFEIVYARK
jgi:small-conductance mechanosensitive channel